MILVTRLDVYRKASGFSVKIQKNSKKFSFFPGSPLYGIVGFSRENLKKNPLRVRFGSSVPDQNVQFWSKETTLCCGLRFNSDKLFSLLRSKTKKKSSSRSIFKRRKNSVSGEILCRVKSRNA